MQTYCMHGLVKLQCMNDFKCQLKISPRERPCEC